MRKTLVLTVGLPRSGKSTWSREMARTCGWVIVNPDSVRLAIHGKAYAPEHEQLVWSTVRLMIKSLFIAGHDTVILDATNLIAHRRGEWQSPNWDVEYEVFKTSSFECIRRAIADNRHDLIPVIERMAANMDPWPPEEE